MLNLFKGPFLVMYRARVHMQYNQKEYPLSRAAFSVSSFRHIVLFVYSYIYEGRAYSMHHMKRMWCITIVGQNLNV